MPGLPFPAVPDIGSVPESLRVLMAVGLTGLLVILRFDAERFSAAEYDDVDRGAARRPWSGGWPGTPWGWASS